jgi:hypothetical protein
LAALVPPDAELADLTDGRADAPDGDGRILGGPLHRVVA